jgi:hypothetical protein
MTDKTPTGNFARILIPRFSHTLFIAAMTDSSAHYFPRFSLTNNHFTIAANADKNRRK